MATKLILDVDTGTDDALALMIAALSPDIDLLAATTVSGNVPVANCTENTLRVFDLLGVDVPVYEGLADPLLRRDHSHVPTIHGEYLEIPPATSTKQSQHAVDFLIDTFMASDGDIVLAPVGPLSNVAMMLTREPRVADKIPEMVIMGGGQSLGNVTPAAEFNIWFDAEAARVVFASGIPMRLMPLDATHQALLTSDHMQQFRQIGTPAAQAAATFTERLGRFHAQQSFVPQGSVPMHDSLVVCAIIDPSVVTTRHVYVDVETAGELTYGQTVMDLYGRSGQPPNCHVAFEVDAEKYAHMMLDLLSISA